MTVRLGLIGGTVFYHAVIFEAAEEKNLPTDFGQAMVLLTDRTAYIPRHGLPGRPYIHPHQVNHAANLSALKSLGINEVVGINSTGSLKTDFAPGEIVLPDDYISLFDPHTSVGRQPLHITPVLHEAVRQKLKRAAEQAGVALRDGGVYWQSRGPRLETRAEVRLIAHFADLVGMTMGSEAAAAQELGLAYASLCSVDNYAHGTVPVPLTEKTIRDGAENNAAGIMKIIEAYLNF